MIGLVVPSYNDKEFLEQLFMGLSTTWAGYPYSALVVDDMSTDGTREWLISVGIDTLALESKGYFTGACNAGIDYWMKNGRDLELILLLNSDTAPISGWAIELISTVKKMDSGITGCTLFNPDGTLQHAGGYDAGYHFDINKPWLRFHQDRYVPWVTGAAMAIRPDVIRRIGLLPSNREQYDASDRNYCAKVWVGGFQIAVSALSNFYHYTHEARAIRLPRGDYIL